MRFLLNPIYSPRPTRTKDPSIDPGIKIPIKYRYFKRLSPLPYESKSATGKNIKQAARNPFGVPTICTILYSVPVSFFSKSFSIFFLPKNRLRKKAVEYPIKSAIATYISPTFVPNNIPASG